MQRSYLDHNATSPLRPEVRDAMFAAYDVEGNPSSVHREGRAARGLIENAREQVAALVGGRASGVIFTSGASEANMQALTPFMKREYQPTKVSKLYVSAVEHPSVLSGGRFASENQTQIPVTASGLVDLDALSALLEGGDAAMIAVMAVNSETGVIQPIKEIGKMAKEFGAWFHVDAVQAAGRIPLDMSEIGCSSLSLSAHKIGGPKGVGALVMAEEGMEPEVLISGGPQENRLRAGTENVAGIVGFAEACTLAAKALEAENGIKQLAHWRDQFENDVRTIAPDLIVFGQGAPRVGNTCQFAIPGLRGETTLIQLDLGGCAVSSGSACSSGKVSASHVLIAMGYEAEIALGAIRVSLGWNSQKSDLDMLVSQLSKICSRNSKKAS